MSAINMCSTSWMSSKSTTRYPIIGKANNNLTLTSIGNMCVARYIYPCSYVWKNPSSYSTTPFPDALQDQLHLHIKPKFWQTVQYTEEEDSSPPTHRRKEKLVQEVLRFLSTMAAQMTARLSPPSALSPPNRYPPWKTKCAWSTIFLTMHPLIQMKSLPSLPAIWSSRGTETPLTYRKPRPAAGPAENSSSRIIPRTLPKMEMSPPLHLSLNPLCHPSPR